MTREELKRICAIYDNFRREKDAATIAYNSDDAFWEHVLAACNLSQPSLPSNLDEAAKDYALKQLKRHGMIDVPCFGAGDIEAFKAGAEWQKNKMMEGQNNTLASDDPATNEEIKKMLKERKAMIDKEVHRRVFNEVEHCWEEAHHEGYVEGWNECEAAYKPKQEPEVDGGANLPRL